MSFWRSGNVLFLILIAVALFAALSYAVTQATGGGVIDISSEKSDLDTAKQQSIQANIDGALWRLKLVNGCRDDEISYETPSGDNANPDAPLNNSCHVYHPDGGGVPYIPLGGGEGGCELTELEIGEGCDRVIYAGELSGVRLYTTASDQGLFQWKTIRTPTPGSNSSVNGIANTDAIASAGLNLHPAGQACRNLGEEWYLPARSELETLQLNKDAIGGFVPGARYWSSHQVSTAGDEYAWTVRFSPDGLSIWLVTQTVNVRCVRRD